MKKNWLAFSGFALVALLMAWSPAGDKTVTVIKHGNETEYRIHLKKVTDSLSVNLADFTSDIEFVKLETKNECLIDWGKYYINPEYILVEISKRGILQFARNGKFIRTLVLAGQGPKEFVEASWTVDEKNQVLIMAVRGKENSFLRFDLKSGKNMDDLKMAVPGRSQGVAYVKENLLMVVPAGLKSKSPNFSYLYNQDMSGNLISSIPANDVPFLDGNRLRFSGHDMLFRFKAGWHDTLYSIANNQMVPFLTFDFGENNPPNNSHVGRKNIYIDSEVGNWVFFNNFFITKVTDGDASGRMAYYVLDKNQGKVYFRNTIFLNPTHHSVIYREDPSFIQRTGLVVYPYQAVTLIAQAKKALADPTFKEPYRSKLKELVSGLTIEDNPVLLIGRYKGH